MKKIFNNKLIYSIFVILFLVIILGTQSFAILPKDNSFTAIKLPNIIYYNLEWCLYLLVPSILVFIVSLILKLKNRTRNKKIVTILLVMSIICLLIVGVEFAIHKIGLREIIYFIEFKN